VAWMAMMGPKSVDYHRATVIERDDDFPGRALRYYGSRGETPLVWGVPVGVGGDGDRRPVLGPVRARRRPGPDQ
jgi:hypothetical protein